MFSSKKKNSESGRSLVELLGVLAIMGVLSVLAVFFFGIAMNRYKANEILNEGQKRAMAASSAIAVGNQGTQHGNTAYIRDYFLSGFDDNELFDVQFGNPVQVAYGEINVPVSNIPSKICEYMKGMAGDNKTGIVSVDGDCSTSGTSTINLAYNVDLMHGVHAVDCSNNPSVCRGCSTCQNGRCLDNQESCGDPSVAKCSDGVCVCLDGRAKCNGTCCTSTQECATNICRELTPDANHCVTNESCPSNNSTTKYCDIRHGTLTYICDDHNSNSCKKYEPAPGTCNTIDLSSFTKKTWKNTTLYYKYALKNWWATRNICLALGKKMATLSRLGLTPTDLKNQNPLLRSILADNNYWIEEDSVSNRCLFLYLDNGTYRLASHPCWFGASILCMD